MAKFGISIDDDLLEEIEEPLEYQDARSERIRELVELGLALERVADEQGVELPEAERDRRAFLRQLFLDTERDG